MCPVKVPTPSSLSLETDSIGEGTSFFSYLPFLGMTSFRLPLDISILLFVIFTDKNLIIICAFTNSFFYIYIFLTSYG